MSKNEYNWILPLCSRYVWKYGPGIEATTISLTGLLQTHWCLDRLECLSRWYMYPTRRRMWRCMSLKSWRLDINRTRNDKCCDDQALSLWIDAYNATLPCLSLSRSSTIMYVIKLYKNYTYETQWGQAKKCKLINSEDASPDSRSLNIRKFWRCIFVRFRNSKTR